MYFLAIVKTLQTYGSANSATGWTETVRETRDVIRGERDVEGEIQQGSERERVCERQRARVNEGEAPAKCTCEDGAHESESESAPWTYGHDRDDHGSPSLEVVIALRQCGLNGMASTSASDEVDVPYDLVCEESRESGKESDHRDGAASV